ncbi:hypothetical protein EVAR_23192_1 [Eumeta japonica]|uniref:Uncharacterized protein n=1 Tax=Eumeta variegata TaxID=151549 RepID=A0A4C1VEB5_EUMVA|nr:hypothetical protein EVAR_23192_1 [Eumeta japonica]
MSAAAVGGVIASHDDGRQHLPPHARDFASAPEDGLQRRRALSPRALKSDSEFADILFAAAMINSDRSDPVGLRMRSADTRNGISADRTTASYLRFLMGVAHDAGAHVGASERTPKRDISHSYAGHTFDSNPVPTSVFDPSSGLVSVLVHIAIQFRSDSILVPFAILCPTPLLIPMSLPVTIPT